MKAKIEIKEFEASLSDLKPTQNNPRQISKADFEKLKKSLREFPEMKSIREVVVDENMRILGGHQRVKALQAIGETTVPVKQVFGLSEEKKREFVIKGNIANGEWDMDLLANEWDDLPLVDWGLSELEKWEEQTEYQNFVDKFKPKLTTDDCYTPPAVFEAVEKWVRNQYKLPDSLETIRPFKPEGDYQAENYKNKVVIDNPPFSILSEIVRWYESRSIKYFLFAPHLTLFATAMDCRFCRVLCGAEVVYENGAVVLTSFLTNLDGPNATLHIAASLNQAIQAAQPSQSADIAKYSRPKNCKVVSDFMASIKAGEDRVLDENECQIVKNLDSLRPQGKGLYGGCILVSDRIADKLAADKLAADKLANAKKPIVIELSEREKEIVARLNDGSYHEKAA